MKDLSLFQLILLSLFGIAIVVGVMVFAGIIPGFRAPSGGTYGTVMVWGTFPDREMSDFVDEFNKVNKSILTLDYVARPKETFESDLLQVLATGQGPDLIILRSDLIYRQGDKLLPIPVESLSPRDFRDTFVTAGEIFLLPGGTRALPLLVDPMVMYYNQSILQSVAVAEVPATWTAFIAALNDINIIDTRGNITRTGAAAGEFANYDNAKELLSLLFLQAGTPIVTLGNNGYQSVLADNFSYTLSPGQAALDFFTQFANPSKTTYSWNRSLPEAKDALAAGILGTYFGFAGEEAEVRAKNPNLDLDVAIVPQRGTGERATLAHVYGVGIAQASPNLEAAAVAAVMLSAPESVALLSSMLGLPPARRDLLASGTTDPFDQIYYESALLGRTWLDPNPTQTEAIWRAMAERVTTGRALSLDSISRASQELEALFR
jgi:ABC-type glycerol-3-phosphate transport system substrate-binding protein